MSATVWQFEHFLPLPFFGIGMKTDIFQSYGHSWVFQICWYIECSSFTASSFRIWTSSIGILPPLLALIIVMLPKAHLTSHSRDVWLMVSDHIIVVIWVMKIFLYSSSVYSCHLFLISSAFIRSSPFLSFILPILSWNVPLMLHCASLKHKHIFFKTVYTLNFNFDSFYHIGE